MKLASLTLLAAAAGVVLSTDTYAQNAPSQRGYLYFSPGRTYSQAARPDGRLQSNPPAAVPATTDPAQPVPAPRTAASLQARRTTWGARYGTSYGSGYPASLFGQVRPVTAYASQAELAQAPAAAAPAAGAAPVPQSPATPQTTLTPNPGYGPAYGGGAPMYGGVPPALSPSGRSGIYGYAGRYYAPGFSYGSTYYGGCGPSYYSYGGCGGWGTPYNSSYYTSGCYNTNACCRAPRRSCTLFGGLFAGCGSSCYVPTPPQCPLTCDPCETGAVYGAPPLMAPQGALAPPDPAPPTPMPPAETTSPPAPVEKKVTPAPQASNTPRIPDLPET